MKIMQFLQCFGFGNQIDAKLQKKHERINETANTCLENKNLADLQARRQTYFIFHRRSVSHSRSEIYCRVIDFIKFNKYKQDDLAQLTLENLNLRHPYGKKHLDRYFNEIKSAILNNSDTYLHQDYQTEMIKVQITNLHELVNEKSTQYFIEGQEASFIKAKVYFLFEQLERSKLVTGKKALLIKIKDYIKNIFVENRFGKNRDEMIIYWAFVRWLLNAYFDFTSPDNQEKVSLAEIREILKDELLGKKLGRNTLIEYAETAIDWAGEQGKYNDSTEVEEALAIINDEELINDLNLVENNTKTKVTISKEELQLRCLKSLLDKTPVPLKYASLPEEAKKRFNDLLNKLFIDCNEITTINNLLTDYPSVIDENNIIHKFNTCNDKNLKNNLRNHIETNILKTG